MTSPNQLEVLDLRHFSASQLRPLLESEARMWQRRLRWDYQSSMELLLQYLDSRILPGFVAVEHGRVYGFTFCVYEGIKAVIGDAYSVASEPEAALQSTHLLLENMLKLLLNSPGVQRIESQMLLYQSGTFSAAFLAEGFNLYQRLFMEYDIAANLAHPTKAHSGLPDFIKIRPWASSFYQSVAELIHACYADHIDAQINDQYRSLHGSLRFLHNIVRFPGCGVFEADQSWLLQDTRDGALVGIILCSRIAVDVAHITQICVAKRHRGHGLGHALLRHCISHLDRSEFASITLTVTESNLQAVKLYEELGFSVRHRFDAMVYDANLGSDADRSGSNHG
jgi:ribosomal protein S18 acetylase RimI-like enzyme